MNALEGAAGSRAAANNAAAAFPATASAEATQITSLQGNSKEIAPRVAQLIKEATEKRYMAGFNTTLNYATGALKASQLGTGEGGSGVVTLLKPGTAAAAASDVVPRDEVAAPKMKTMVKTMFVMGGPAPVVVAQSEDASPVEKKEK